jgi:seryl-tRNA synthetase
VHDLRFLRTHRALVEAGVRRKRVDLGLDAFYAAETRRVALLAEIEEKKARRNAGSERIPALKKAGQDASALLAEMKRLAEEIKVEEARLKALEAEVEETALWIPNFPHESVPDGAGPEDNLEVATWGSPPTLAFAPRPHWEIAESLGLIDFARGPRIAGGGFPLFVGDGARLVRALVDFMLEHHLKRGYVEVHPPIVIHAASLVGTGQLPKLASEMYRLADDDLWLNPTAEVPVTNIYRDEILEPGVVPRRLTAYLPSFRREAGAYGKDTRGIVRVHQFDKVELVRFALPERSYDELEELRGDVESVLRALEIPYRVVLLCAPDLSFAAAKCYDFEVWAAGEGRWLEASSCSNFEQFQARRSGIRFRRAAGEKPEYAATLNASGLALPRTLVALLENNQQADGSVLLPKALRPFLGGQERLAPR